MCDRQHPTNGGKMVQCTAVIIIFNWLKTNNLILLAMNIITSKPHRKMVLQLRASVYGMLPF